MAVSNDGLGRKSPKRTALLGLGPLVLLALFVAAFLAIGPLGVFSVQAPPVEKLTIERAVLRSDEIVLHVTNGGPDSVTIAQVLIDDAYWRHTVTPARTIERLGRAVITAPYPWIAGEPVVVKLLTNTGLTIEHEIPVAVETPQADARYFWTFALIGVYVGVVPIVIGLLWFPFLRQVSRAWLTFFLSLTGGLLVFLGVSSLAEALETKDKVPDAFQGLGIVLIGVLGTFLLLTHIVKSSTRGTSDGPGQRRLLALLIAVGIGLHNLGEGLAIGAAYTLGEVALGTFLVLGFLIHNTTEGLGIAAPLAVDRPPLRTFALLGAVAGAPTILGAWIGGFVYSPVFATLFLAIGAGAIFQVVYEISKMMIRRADSETMAAYAYAGFLVGLLIMYLTGLLVAA
jgi:zinc transporter ZupT